MKEHEEELKRDFPEIHAAVEEMIIRIISDPETMKRTQLLGQQRIDELCAERDALLAEDAGDGASIHG